MILAIDPSLSSTGFCVMTRQREIITLGKIVTTNKDTESKRIFTIANCLDNLIEQHKIEHVVLEGQFLHRNAKTLMQLSRLRGAIAYIIESNEIEATHLQPSEVRLKVMGSGKADKEEVATFIQEQYVGNSLIGELIPFCDRNCKAKNSDIYDAISIGLAYCTKDK